MNTAAGTVIANRHRPCPTCAGTGKIPACAQAPPDGTLGKRISDLAADRGLTQVALAILVGRTQPSVSQWINGKRKPNHDDLCQLADLFGTTVDYLIGRTDER